jgi:hypothetical protein
MSWLSELFHPSSPPPPAPYTPPPDNSAQIMQMQLDYLDKLRADQAAKDAAAAAKDPTATREAALQSINSRYAPGFETNYLPDVYDDPLANTVYGEQRGKADDYLNALLKRGVITQSGFNAGAKNLDEQGSRVRTQLQGIGQSILDAERAKLGGIADTGRQRASSLGVNEAFDFTPYDTQIQSALGDFGSKFSDEFRAGIPGDLFDTTSLKSVAGGAQGVGNTPFDTTALAGLDTSGTTDENDPFAQKPVQKRTSTVF